MNKTIRAILYPVKEIVLILVITLPVVVMLYQFITMEPVKSKAISNALEKEESKLGKD